MATPQVNGDVPRSHFLHHLSDYPVVRDGVDTFKSSAIGQKSIHLGDQAYRTFAPVLPYLNKPYEYVQPYVERADSIGDGLLATLDSNFPIVKKPTGELYSGARGLVYLPYNKYVEGKGHVCEIYSRERQNLGGDNDGTYITSGKAAATTVVVLGAETYKFLQTFTRRNPSTPQRGEQTNQNENQNGHSNSDNKPHN